MQCISPNFRKTNKHNKTKPTLIHGSRISNWYRQYKENSSTDAQTESLSAKLWTALVLLVYLLAQFKFSIGRLRSIQFQNAELVVCKVSKYFLSYKINGGMQESTTLRRDDYSKGK